MYNIIILKGELILQKQAPVPYTPTIGKGEDDKRQGG